MDLDPIQQLRRAKMAHLSEAAVVQINEICDRYKNQKGQYT